MSLAVAAAKHPMAVKFGLHGTNHRARCEPDATLCSSGFSLPLELLWGSSTTDPVQLSRGHFWSHRRLNPTNRDTSTPVRVPQSDSFAASCWRVDLSFMLSPFWCHNSPSFPSTSVFEVGNPLLDGTVKIEPVRESHEQAPRVG